VHFGCPRLKVVHKEPVGNSWGYRR
jgi:hypothetical protein